MPKRLRGPTSTDQVTLLTLQETQGPGMGRKRVYVPGTVLSCRVLPLTGSLAIALAQLQVRQGYRILFADDPGLDPLRHRLQYRGNVLRLSGPVTPTPIHGSPYTVMAEYHTDDQPQPT